MSARHTKHGFISLVKSATSGEWRGRVRIDRVDHSTGWWGSRAVAEENARRLALREGCKTVELQADLIEGKSGELVYAPERTA
jgi:hypothetical protein